MEPTPPALAGRIRDALVARAAALVLVAMLLVVGLFPGPALVLMGDPAWRTHAVVRKFVEERAYWTSGVVVIVGPALVLANMLPDWFDGVWEGVRSRVATMRAHWFVLGAAFFAVSAAAAASIYVFARQPTSSDEVAQLWHARILLAGRLSLPPDVNPEFFAVDNVIDQGRWYSQFPIGGPAVFAVAVMLRSTWLLNPVLAGLTVVNVYRFASQAYGAPVARVSAVLCATCPFLLLMSGTYMNHTLVVFLTTLALAEVPAWTGGADSRRLRASIVIGLSLGAAIAVRPLDGAIAALALGGVVVYEAVRRRHVRALVATAAAGALPVALLLAANHATTGGSFLFGYEVLWGANHSLGFHDSPSGPPHTPARALGYAVAYLVQLNWALFEWPVAGLLVLAGAFVAIGRLGRWEAMLCGWALVQLVAYAAYWHAGILFGPRYLTTIVPALLILAARGIVAAEGSGWPALRRAVVAGVAASLASSWLIPSTPVGALGEAKGIRPLRAAFKMDLRPVITSLGSSPALIFVGETASSRLVRRLWGLGISRPDAARLMVQKDNCALLEAAMDETRRVASPGERLARFEATPRYSPPPGRRLLGPDATFRISNEASLTPRCQADLIRDTDYGQSISYGTALLLNQIGSDGRITGPVVFVVDLGGHNEVLRGRFGDRPWYRLAPPDAAGERVPRLVPY